MIWLFELERGLFRVYLLVLCVSLLRRIVRSVALPRPPAPARWPSVTVQLLVCDEPAAAARAIACLAALDYPGELHLDVLDDSVDPGPVQQAVTGTGIRVLRRPDRAGHKAGNLAAGLARAEGELIAVFDADAAPRPDFLLQTVPHLVAEPRLALVQARQTFPDREASLLTRAQGLLLDGLMLVEQPGQSHRGRPLHFNGSAGVWRKAAIESAGGWSSETSAEDLDLSHRAVLAGWRLRSLPDVTVASELPERMAAFRVQQARWTRGKVEVLRRNVGTIIRAPLSFGAKLDLIVPAASRLLYPFLFFLCLTMPFTTFDWLRPAVRYGVADGAAILGVVTLCAALYYARAAHLAGRSAVAAALQVPAVIALLLGLSLSSTVAFARGLLGGPTVFHRTPKRGDRATPIPRGERLSAWIELLLGLAYLGFTALALSRGLYPAAAFFAFVAAAWLWVGGASLRTDPPHSRNAFSLRIP